MKRIPDAFDKTESAILNALYEASNDRHTSYTLANVVNPEAQMSTPEMLEAFIEARQGTEKLIGRGLVKAGERNSGANGVYFNKLKLTTKGEKAAIQHRHAASEKKTGLSDSEKADFNDVLKKLKDD
jgi:hypothetical protein